MHNFGGKTKYYGIFESGLLQGILSGYAIQKDKTQHQETFYVLLSEPMKQKRTIQQE